MHKIDLDALQVADGGTPLEQSSRLPAAPHLYPDLGLEAALKLFGSHPALPVVRRNAHGTVVGILTLEDVARALRIERRAGGWPMAG
jgi:CBS domain-containing protein